MSPHSKGRFRIEIVELEQRAVPAIMSCNVGTLLPPVQAQPVVILTQPATTGEVPPGHAYGHEHAPGWLEHHPLGGGGRQDYPVVKIDF